LGAGYVTVDLGDFGSGSPGGSSPAAPDKAKQDPAAKRSVAAVKKPAGSVPLEPSSFAMTETGRGEGHGRGSAVGDGSGGSGGGIGEGHGGGGGEGSLSQYVRQVLLRIEQRKQYPRISQQTGEEGMVLVDLRIGRSGELLGYELRNGSSERLMQATKNSIQAAAPFPPLPKQYPKEVLTLQVPVRYQLN
jgi:TonB family protein